MATLPQVPNEAAKSIARLEALAEKARRDAERAKGSPADTGQAKAEPAKGSPADAGQANAEPVAKTEPQAEEQSIGPVGTGEHVVKSGECISSIAKDTGHFWETIWQDGANTELREVRKDPNVLLPGDRVHVPEIRKKQESGETEMRHRFQRRGEPAWFRLRVLDEGEPRAGVPYIFEVDGNRREGLTDANGNINEPIAGNASRGKLILLNPEDESDREEILLEFGGLDPSREVRGAVERLENLGFAAGGPVDEMNDEVRAALREFQKSVALPETGRLDEATRQRLEKEHGG